jgi:hypothetical protein
MRRALPVVLPVLALATALAAAGGACSPQGTHLTTVAGDSLPSMRALPAAGITLVAPTSSANPATVAITQPGNAVFAASGTTGGAGDFYVNVGGDNSGAFELALEGGTFLDPSTLTLVTVTAGETLYTAAIDVPRGGFGRVTFSPLSTMAWWLERGIRATTGEDAETAIAEANEAVSLYFSDNPGLVPGVDGPILWDVGAPQAGPLGPDTLAVSLVAAAVAGRAHVMGVTLETYVAALAADAADGVVDGVVEPPLAAGPTPVSAFAQLAGYPSAPIGATLAADIVSFFPSLANAAGVPAAAGAPLVARLQARDGRIFPGAPLLKEVDSPATPGSRTLTLIGEDLDRVTEVLIDGVAGAGLRVSLTSASVDASPAVPSGVPVWVTVVNAAGFRHSLLVTLSFP